VPGMIPSRRTESSTPVYTLRGVGFYETSLAAYPDVSVYLDQAPLPFPGADDTVAVRCPASRRSSQVVRDKDTLFGNTRHRAGAINYIANKADRKTSPPAPSSATGRYNTGQIDGFVSGPDH